jgi:hypothetical protein
LRVCISLVNFMFQMQTCGASASMAQSSGNNLITSGQGSQTSPLQSAFARFQSTLSPRDQADFRYTTLQHVVLEVQRLDERQVATSISRKIGSRIDPLISFLQRYARALDTMVQAYPYPSALIWGLLRVLLVVSSVDARYLVET